MTISKDDRIEFLNERKMNINELGEDKVLATETNNWLIRASNNKYSYNFDWLGLPIIQFPQDIVAVQEVIWKTKPDIIIETGVARGGSLILSASILQLLNNDGKVIGIDIDIRSHNREAIESHPLANRIVLIQGSSVDESPLNEAKKLIKPHHRVMVILDSNHTHEHVFKELQLYAPLVTKDCYMIVMDTVVDNMPEDYFPNRPWGKGNNPKTAVHEYLKSTDRFEIDSTIHNKLLITVAPDGYLKCIK
jgi:cephalosporin hydroxylase